jgi:hypothetical protein
MEFLMTYGWAILVVLAAIGALAYFGILSPGNILPNDYRMSGGISAGEYKLTTAGTVTLGMQNSMGADVQILDAVVDTTNKASDVTCSVVAWNETPPYTLVDGAKTSFDFAGCTVPGSATGQRLKADVRVTYKKVSESVNHTITGTLGIKSEN